MTDDKDVIDPREEADKAMSDKIKSSDNGAVDKVDKKLGDLNDVTPKGDLSNVDSKNVDTTSTAFNSLSGEQKSQLIEDSSNVEVGGKNYTGEYLGSTINDGGQFERQAEAQSWGSKAGRGLVRFGGEFLLNVIETPGVVGGALAAGATMDSKKMTHNFWVNWVEGAKDELVKANEIYSTEEYKNKGVFGKMSSVDFWATEGASGAAFFTSALVPGLAVGKAAKAASLAKLMAKGSKGTRQAVKTAEKALKKLDDVKLGAKEIDAGVEAGAKLDSALTNAATTMTNTTFESGIEARGVAESYMRELDDSFNSGEIGLEQYNNLKQEAGIAARDTFFANYALLVVPNGINTRMLNGARGSNKLLKNIGITSEKTNSGAHMYKAFDKTLAKEAAKEGLEQGSKHAAIKGMIDGLKTAGKIASPVGFAKNTFREGIVEEMGQMAIEETFGVDKLNADIQGIERNVKDVAFDFARAYSHVIQSDEGWTAALLSGILSGPMSVYSNYKTNKNKAESNEKTLGLIQSAMNMHTVLNNGFIKKDDNGNVVIENGEVVWLADKVADLANVVASVEQTEILARNLENEGRAGEAAMIRSQLEASALFPFIATGNEGKEAYRAAMQDNEALAEEVDRINKDPNLPNTTVQKELEYKMGMFDRVQEEYASYGANYIFPTLSSFDKKYGAQVGTEEYAEIEKAREEFNSGLRLHHSGAIAANYAAESRLEDAEKNLQKVQSSQAKKGQKEDSELVKTAKKRVEREEKVLKSSQELISFYENDVQIEESFEDFYKLNFKRNSEDVKLAEQQLGELIKELNNVSTSKEIDKVIKNYQDKTGHVINNFIDIEQSESLTKLKESSNPEDLVLNRVTAELSMAVAEGIKLGVFSNNSPIIGQINSLIDFVLSSEKNKDDVEDTDPPEDNKEKVSEEKDNLYKKAEESPAELAKELKQLLDKAYKNEKPTVEKQKEGYIKEKFFKDNLKEFINSLPEKYGKSYEEKLNSLLDEMYYVAKYVDNNEDTVRLYISQYNGILSDMSEKHPTAFEDVVGKYIKNLSVWYSKRQEAISKKVEDKIAEYGLKQDNDLDKNTDNKEEDITDQLTSLIKESQLQKVDEIRLGKINELDKNNLLPSYVNTEVLNSKDVDLVNSRINELIELVQNKEQSFQLNRYEDAKELYFLATIYGNPEVYGIARDSVSDTNILKEVDTFYRTVSFNQLGNISETEETPDNSISALSNDNDNDKEVNPNKSQEELAAAAAWNAYREANQKVVEEQVKESEKILAELETAYEDNSGENIRIKDKVFYKGQPAVVTMAYGIKGSSSNFIIEYEEKDSKGNITKVSKPVTKSAISKVKPENASKVNELANKNFQEDFLNMALTNNPEVLRAIHRRYEDGKGDYLGQMSKAFLEYLEEPRDKSKDEITIKFTRSDTRGIITGILENRKKRKLTPGEIDYLKNFSAEKADQIITLLENGAFNKTEYPELYADAIKYLAVKVIVTKKVDGDTKTKPPKFLQTLIETPALGLSSSNNADVTSIRSKLLDMIAISGLGINKSNSGLGGKGAATSISGNWSIMTPGSLNTGGAETNTNLRDLKGYENVEDIKLSFAVDKVDNNTIAINESKEKTQSILDVNKGSVMMEVKDNKGKKRSIVLTKKSLQGTKELDVIMETIASIALGKKWSDLVSPEAKSMLENDIPALNEALVDKFGENYTMGQVYNTLMYQNYQEDGTGTLEFYNQGTKDVKVVFQGEVIEDVSKDSKGYNAIKKGLGQIKTIPVMFRQSKSTNNDKLYLGDKGYKDYIIDTGVLTSNLKPNEPLFIAVQNNDNNSSLSGISAYFGANNFKPIKVKKASNLPNTKVGENDSKEDIAAENKVYATVQKKNRNIMSRLSEVKNDRAFIKKVVKAVGQTKGTPKFKNKEEFNNFIDTNC